MPRRNAAGRVIEDDYGYVDLVMDGIFVGRHYAYRDGMSAYRIPDVEHLKRPGVDTRFSGRTGLFAAPRMGRIRAIKYGETAVSRGRFGSTPVLALCLRSLGVMAPRAPQAPRPERRARR